MSARVSPDLVVVGAGAAVLLLLLYNARQIAGAAADAVGAVAGGVNNVATGIVGGIGSTVGLPTPDQTISDPAVVRHILDTQGWFEASKQGTAMAFFEALGMSPGSGHPGGAGVGGTSTSPRTTDPAGASWSELANDTIDWFDPRYYGSQGNVILQAETNQAGPGSGTFAAGATRNAGAFFDTSNPLGSLSGM